MKGNICNDFIIPLLDKNIANNQRGQHFVIFFDPDNLKYYIRDLGQGLGTF